MKLRGEIGGWANWRRSFGSPLRAYIGVNPGGFWGVTTNTRFWAEGRGEGSQGSRGGRVDGPWNIIISYHVGLQEVCSKVAGFQPKKN